MNPLRSLFAYFIIIITPYEFFTPELTGGLSLESDWQQVSSSLQDSPEYSS